MGRFYKKIVLLVVICLVFSLTGCRKTVNNSENTTSSNTKLNVSVTFHALAEFVSAVGQDKVVIHTMTPDGTEPHDFEPKAADIAKLYTADVFVYNGLGMESWVEEALNASDNKDLVIVDSSKNCTPIKTEVNNGHNSEGTDPHLWISIKGAEIEVQNIADGLSQADPDNKEFYEANSAAYIEQLEQLYQEYNKKFQALDNKSFVTGHAAFNYFCRDFGLQQNSVEDVFADGEPSTKQLADLVEYCKTNHVTTIFSEYLKSPEISSTLAKEVGANVEEIYTMESAEDNLSYLDRMKYNCEQIYESLSK